MAGLALPAGLNPLRGFIPLLVVALLFLSALRLDPQTLRHTFAGLPSSLPAVLALQLAPPLVVLLVATVIGLGETPLALALTLVFAAPSIVGSPNLCLMLGIDPAPALRLLVAGTFVLPLTVLPVLWAMPQLGGPAEILAAAARLAATLVVTILAAALFRRLLLPTPTQAALERLDGLSAIALAVFVVALMPAVTETALAAPMQAAGWAAVALTANFGAQLATFRTLRHRRGCDAAAATSVIAGNRNLALFLVALPPATTDAILPFVGFYQVPMYLTPLVMARLYRMSARHPRKPSLK